MQSMGDLVEMRSPGGNQGKRNFDNEFEPEPMSRMLGLGKPLKTLTRFDPIQGSPDLSSRPPQTAEMYFLCSSSISHS